MYAGIHRISATSRKSTRNEARNTLAPRDSANVIYGPITRDTAAGGRELRSLQAKLLECLGRAAGPLRHRRVADVAEILNPHLTGPEAACGKVAEAAEERLTVRQPWFQVAVSGNVVEN